jgi:ABC-2 type transport system permease protein
MLVNKGDLDYHLVRPVSPQFILSLKEFSFSSLVNFFMALGILIWSLSAYQGDKGFWSLLMLMGLVVCGACIFYLCHFTILMQVFWTHSASGASSVHYSLCNFAEKPHRIFPGPMRLLLTSVLPYSMISSLPAEVFFGSNRLEGFLRISGSLLFMVLIQQFIWRKALRAYSSASS